MGIQSSEGFGGSASRTVPRQAVHTGPLWLLAGVLSSSPHGLFVGCLSVLMTSGFPQSKWPETERERGKKRKLHCSLCLISPPRPLSTISIVRIKSCVQSTLKEGKPGSTLKRGALPHPWIQISKPSCSPIIFSQHRSQSDH